ncbi:MAG: hypothetical protein WCZ99_02860 [Candidatus Paceibacterota bacterium]|nr:hypothetical protein [Candidatus Paceibacterota bacterium]
MNKTKKLLLSFQIFLIELRELPSKIKRRIWNKRILLWWNRLWIRKDEFHPSLNSDVEAMMEMTKEEKTAYLKDLMIRRRIAHLRDLEE